MIACGREGAGKEKFCSNVNSIDTPNACARFCVCQNPINWRSSSVRPSISFSARSLIPSMSERRKKRSLKSLPHADMYIQAFIPALLDGASLNKWPKYQSKIELNQGKYFWLKAHSVRDHRKIEHVTEKNLFPKKKCPKGSVYTDDAMDYFLIKFIPFRFWLS